MKTKSFFATLIATILIILVAGLVAPSVVAQTPPGEAETPPGGSEPPPGEAGPDPAYGATNPSYSMSDSPWLRLPDDMLDWPPVEPSRPAEVIAVEDPTAVEIHDAATGATLRIPSADLSQQSVEPGLTSVPPYQGLLPPGILGPESVLGSDERVYVSSVTTYPWRTVVKLFITFPDSAQGGCSGSIIGCPDGHGYHVLTAGHCVYSHSHGGWATSIKVVPGLDWSYMPYNYAWMTYMRSYTGWTVSGMSEHDWAMITLDRNVGDYTGWMGRMTAGSGSSIYTDIQNTAGYPGDLSSGLRMYWNSNSGHSADSYNHWYYLDTAGGQSGSPVWRYVSDSRYILTVHTCGTGGCGVSGKSCNHGTRLNNDKFDRIYTWCGSDTPPTDYADLIDDGQAYSGFSPTTVTPGATSFHAWSDVRNIGTASSGGFYVRYYASTNTYISTYDYLIGSDYVSSISAFNSRDSDWNGTFPTGAPDGTYWVGWIIDAYDNVTEFDESNNTAYKSSYQLVVCNVPPSAPTLYSPADGSTTNDTTPFFDWGSVSGASSYQIQVDDFSSFLTPVISQTTSSSYYIPSSALADGTYYWRVRALNSCGDGPWSSAWQFEIGPVPDTPALSSPEHGSDTCDDTPTFSWGSASGADSYTIQVDNNSSFISPEINDTTPGSSTSYTPASALAHDAYFWRVRATNTYGNSPWSSIWNLDILNCTITEPTGLTANAVSQNQIDLTWTDNSSDEDSFSIERSPDGASGWVEVGTVPSDTTTYNDTGLGCNANYYYRVRARAGTDQYSDYSNVDGATTQACSLSAPMPLTATTVSEIQIDLTWTDNSTDEDSFRLERSPNGTTGWTEIGLAPADSAAYNDTGLGCNTTYHYRVRAYAAPDQYSDYSNVAYTDTLACSLNAPTNLAATALSESQIALTWTDNSAEEDSFRLERSPNGTTDWMEVGSVPTNTTIYTDTALSCGTTYHYRVRARSGADYYSGYSNTDSDTTQACSLDAPTNLEATALSGTQIGLAWTDNSSSPSEDSFRIERSPNGATGWMEVGSVPTNTTIYTDAALTCNTAYHYRVRAYSSPDQYSSYSNSATTTTLACPSLVITKVDSPDPVEPGGLLLYTLTISNSGAGLASNLVINDIVPISTTFASASHTATLETGNVISWTVDSLTSGVSINRTFVVTVSEALTGGQVITNSTYSVLCDQVSIPAWGTAVTTTVQKGAVTGGVYLPVIRKQ